MSKLDAYLARQQAVALADAAITRAAGPRTGGRASSPVVFATTFEEHADLPEGTAICKMSPTVATALAAAGLHEPVSIRRLPGKWWRLYVDLAALGLVAEPGCGMTEVVASSEELHHRFIGYYKEIIAGPFDSEEEADERRTR